jgi:biopolymer transport protein ExbD
MAFRKSRFRKNKNQDGNLTLQITAMADVFVVIVIFLIKAATTGSVNITPSKGLLMAEAMANQDVFEALKIEVTENSVNIEGKPAAFLDDFRFESSDLTREGSSASLSGMVERERRRQLLIAEQNPDVKIEGKVIIVADQRVPYHTIKAVLASTAIHGYTDFKLAVVRPE